MAKFVLFLVFLFSHEGFAQTIYITPQEALKIHFRDSEEVISEKKAIPEEAVSSLEKKLGAPLPKREWTFYLGRTKGKIDGYALIDNEIGKTEPITFLTVITPTGEVRGVEVLIFREPIGSEVHERRFLRQFDKKRVSDPVRIGQDIRSITGATLSARAVSRGVKRALILREHFYGKPQ